MIRITRSFHCVNTVNITVRVELRSTHPAPLKSLGLVHAKIAKTKDPCVARIFCFVLVEQNCSSLLVKFWLRQSDVVPYGTVMFCALTQSEVMYSYSRAEGTLHARSAHHF